MSVPGSADTTSKRAIDARTAWLLTHGELPPPARTRAMSETEEISAEDILQIAVVAEEFERIAEPLAARSPAFPPRPAGAPPAVTPPELASPQSIPPALPARESAAPSMPVIEVPRRGGRVPWLVGGIALGVLASLCALVAARFMGTRGPYPRSSITVVQPSSTSADADPRAGIPSVHLDSLPAAPAPYGTLRFSPSARDHRVYVDGALAGDSNAPLRVRCGRHLVRVGSRGDAQNVDVPCGDAVDVK